MKFHDIFWPVALTPLRGTWTFEGPTLVLKVLEGSNGQDTRDPEEPIGRGRTGCGLDGRLFSKVRPAVAMGRLDVHLKGNGKTTWMKKESLLFVFSFPWVTKVYSNTVAGWIGRSLGDWKDTVRFFPLQKESRCVPTKSHAFWSYFLVRTPL